MATRTEQKAQAREERLARQQADEEAARRRRRLLWFGGALLVAAVAVAVVIAISSSSSSSSGTTGGTAAPKAVASVSRLLGGIPQSGNQLGKASAPVTVTLYEDLQCPICRDFTLGAENQLIAKDVRAGRAKLVFRSLQTATPDAPTFQAQQQAAVAAGKQQKLWHYVELFYHQQGPEGTGYADSAFLDKLGRQVPGLDQAAWQSARKTPAVARQVSADQALAQAKGFNATPTITVQGPKSSPQPVNGAVDYATLEGLVKQAGG